MLALRDDGRMVGSVSGGCIEDDLMRAREGALDDAPARLTYGVTRDEAARFGLPCGGTLRLISEPLRDTQWLDLVLESIRGHRLIQRTVDLHDGASSVSPAGPADGPDFDGRIFRSVYGPRWRLLIIGANQTAQVLASVAATLDFHVTVCDPREEFHGDWNRPRRPCSPACPMTRCWRSARTNAPPSWPSPMTPSSTTWPCWKR